VSQTDIPLEKQKKELFNPSVIKGPMHSLQEGLESKNRVNAGSMMFWRTNPPIEILILI